MRQGRERLLLYAGFVIALLPVIAMRDFTPPNELRYLSIADEALRNHTLFAFTNHGVAYADKPPLYMWILMLCRWLTGGHHTWLLALFSLVPALGIVGVMDSWTRQELDGESRGLARLVTLTSGIWVTSAVTVRMDMLMCLFVVLALREFWRMVQGTGGRRSRWLFPLCLFLALFTKGALGLLIPLVGTVTYLLLTRRWRLIARCWGWRTWAVLGALCLAWFAAVYAEGGPDYLHNLVVRQTVDRAVHSFRHSKPFYYYAVSIWYCLAPWSLLVIGAFAASLRPSVVKSDLQRFMLTMGVSAFVLLSCISSKLQIYLLPAVPFITYGAAMFLPLYRNSTWAQIAVAVPAMLYALALPALYVVAGMNLIPWGAPGMFYAAAAVVTLAGIFALYQLLALKSLAGAMRRLGAGLLAAVMVGAFALPVVNRSIGYGELCRQTQQMARQHGVTQICAWRMRRAENMDVYLHRPITILPKDSDAAAVAPHPCLLLIRIKDAPRFSGQEVRQVGGEYELILNPQSATGDFQGVKEVKGVRGVKDNSKEN